MCKRAGNMIRQVAGRNPGKQVFVVSPFYCGAEDLDHDTRPALWRRVLKKLTAEAGLPNVTYIDGLDVLDNISYMSADEVHPNIIGVARIEEQLAARIVPALK